MMKRLLLLLTLLLVSIVRAQDITFDGNNCAADGQSEWGIPDLADNDTDGDGYGERDTPTGTSDVLNLWAHHDGTYFYLAFERRKTGNSFFAFYLNTDCDPDTGDASKYGADMALAFDIRPGNSPAITDNTIYSWDGSAYVSTGRSFEAKVGKESCEGDKGKFFEFRIPLSNLVALCGASDSCKNIGITLASAMAGGSPNSKLKDQFDAAFDFGVNSNPTAAITGPAEACAGSEISFSAAGSTAYDATQFTAETAPDYRDRIALMQWDMDYDGITFSEDMTGEAIVYNFPMPGTYTVALQVTDAWGCMHMTETEVTVFGSPEAVINFTQNEDCPMQVSLNASSSLPSDDTASISSYEWDMNYDGEFQSELTGENLEYNFMACGTYTVALRVTEENGNDNCNTHTVVQTIEVTDSEAPQFTVPADVILSAGTDITNLELTGNVTDAVDNCEVATIDWCDEEDLNACGGGSIKRTWKVSDACGNTTTKVQMITLEEPVSEVSITAPEDVMMACGNDYIPCIDFENISDISAFQHAGRNIYISAGSGNQSRTPALFNSAAPEPGDTDLGTPNTDFGGPGIGASGAADGIHPNFIPRKNVLIVQKPGATVPDDSPESGSYLEFDLTEFAGARLGSISLLDLEENQTNKRIEFFDHNGQLTATLPIPNMGDNGALTLDLSTYENVFKLRVVLDGSGAVTSLCFLNAEYDFGMAQATATCGTLPGIWFEDELNYNSCTLEEIKRTWYTTDMEGNLYSDVQIIRFEDTTPPEFKAALPEDLEVSCGEIPEAATLCAIDDCSPEVTVNLDEEEVVNSCGAVEKVIRTWTATDCSGNTAEHIQTITIIDDVAPVFNEDLPADVSVSCGAMPDIDQLTATDNCSNTVEVSYSEQVEETNSCGVAIVIKRTWTAEDCFGNTAVHTQTITITDTEAPVFITELPEDLTLECGELQEPEQLLASDNCDSAVVVEFAEESSQGSCPGETVVTRTWTARDCAGNSTEHTQTITITDNEAPLPAAPWEETISVYCSEVGQLPQPEFTDNCGEMGKVTYSEENTSAENGADYTIYRTWVVNDQCGNSATYTQTVTVVNMEEEMDLSPLSLCVEDAPFNLNTLLPQGTASQGQWTNVSTGIDLDETTIDPSELQLGNYTLEFRGSDGRCGVRYRLPLEIQDDCLVLPCTSSREVTISKTITPNGDAYNEYFTVNGVDPNCGFRITVKIFNRWGLQVYSSPNYQNNWNGFTSDASLGQSGKVPAGTYYYIVTLENSGFKPFTGYLYVGTGSN